MTCYHSQIWGWEEFLGICDKSSRQEIDQGAVKLMIIFVPVVDASLGFPVPKAKLHSSRDIDG